MTDLIVVGGGPAGLATALHARRAGLEVALIEKRSGSIDKACGEGLMPHALRHLETLGIQPGGRPITGISYLDAHRRVDARFPGRCGRGVRRTVLHRALLDATMSSGVRLINESADDVRQDASSVTVNGHRAQYLVAADGLHSPIRRSLDLEQVTRGPRRWGIRRHVRIAPWSAHVEVHWARDSEAYVTPVSDDSVNIAILTTRRGSFATHLEEFPSLLAHIDGYDHEPDRAAGPLRQRVSYRSKGRILLVGDAAGYIDALTGEGLGLAFGAAELAVASIVAERPDTYDRRWRQLTRRYRLLTLGILTAGAHPPIRRAVVPMARTLPGVFGSVVTLLAA